MKFNSTNGYGDDGNGGYRMYVIGNLNRATQEVNLGFRSKRAAHLPAGRLHLSSDTSSSTCDSNVIQLK
jgi:hypothetical protein